MKITIVLEHEGSDTCLVHEASSFQDAIAALSGFAEVMKPANTGLQQTGGTCAICGEPPSAHHANGHEYHG